MFTGEVKRGMIWYFYFFCSYLSINWILIYSLLFWILWAPAILLVRLKPATVVLCKFFFCCSEGEMFLIVWGAAWGDYIGFLFYLCHCRVYQFYECLRVYCNLFIWYLQILCCILCVSCHFFYFLCCSVLWIVIFATFYVAVLGK